MTPLVVVAAAVVAAVAYIAVMVCRGECYGAE